MTWISKSSPLSKVLELPRLQTVFIGLKFDQYFEFSLSSSSVDNPSSDIFNSEKTAEFLMFRILLRPNLSPQRISVGRYVAFL